MKGNMVIRWQQLRRKVRDGRNFLLFQPFYTQILKSMDFFNGQIILTVFPMVNPY